MEIGLQRFPNGLPTLEKIREYNKGSDAPPEPYERLLRV